MRPTRSLLVAALIAVAAPSAPTARADDDAPAAPRLTVPAHRYVVSGLLVVSLSKDAAFSPVSVAPDVWYGVTDKLTVGLVHSSRALGGFLGGAGDALCLTGTGGGCRGFYDHAGLLVRQHLVDGPLTVAFDGGLVARSFDPFALTLKVGAAARWQQIGRASCRERV